MKLKKIFSKLKTYILSSPKLLLGLILLFIIVLLVCAAPFLTSYSPTHLSDDLLVPPLTKGHFLGTTNMGEDVWSQILYGGRVSLKIGIVACPELLVSYLVVCPDIMAVLLIIFLQRLQIFF